MVAFEEQRGLPGNRAQRRPSAVVIGSAALLLFWVWAGSTAKAADVEDGQELLRTGRYEECARLAASGIRSGPWNEGWYLLKVQAEMAQGRYEDALRSVEEGLRRTSASVALRLLAIEVFRYNGREAAAAAALDQVERLVRVAPERYATPDGRVALGRYLLLRGADPRKVLDQFYDVAIKEQPDFVETYFAEAELALAKQDHALAGDTLRKAPRDAQNDPRYHCLLAQALSDDDRAASDKELAEALRLNPQHAASLLLRADHLIDSERYAEAADVLERVLAVNPHEPRAWAYRAVLAHLKEDRDGESRARRSALTHWPSNPEVDHLIGRKLSQKYRFAEGSVYQRHALELDPESLPAKLQLCQDLLRLGEEDEGWKLADEVFAHDRYNVVAYNLITLRDRLGGFRTLRDDEFLVRMDAREADLYGRRAVELLHRARQELCAKYGATISGPVTVEIFPQKKEFAVRTFGLPGAEGLLGVCFGRVITAASPASQGEEPANWESVLWHEFCHAVTLHQTHNKMPRWLSEGISVYEEGLRNPACAPALNPHFRAMMLGDGLTPLSKLSGAFMAPKTPLHLQFAYFESALAVAFLVERAGLPALKGVLDDLGSGRSLNEALPGRAKMSLEQLDREFAEFARRKAESIAPEATWEEPDLPGDADSAAIGRWLKPHPKSFWGLQRLGAKLVAEQQWGRAQETLVQLKGLYPEYVGAENAYMLLATVYRHESNAAAERAVLEELAMRDADASPAYLRLMELDEAEQNWRSLERDALRLLAVNPMIAAPHRQLARAAEHLGKPDQAVAAYRALARLDDTDPAEIHFRLAKLLHQTGRNAEARREVLKALEDAPRFREAHQLLLDLVEPDKAAPAPARSGAASPPRPRVTTEDPRQ